jgi:hypothetical protein
MEESSATTDLREGNSLQVLAGSTALNSSGFHNFNSFGPSKLIGPPLAIELSMEGSSLP